MNARTRRDTPLPGAARERLAARARQIAAIRRGVAIAVLAALVLAWGVIAYAGPMGSSSTTATGASGTTSTDGSSGGSWSGSSNSSSGGPGAVTTTQS